MSRIPVFALLLSVASFAAPAVAGELPPFALADDAVSPGFGYGMEEPSHGLVGILDPAKLKMSHTMTFGYQSGGGATPSGGSGFYENRLSYQLHERLNATVYLGYEIASPYRRSEDESRIVPGLSLTYTPSDNTLIHFSYRRLNGGYGRYGSYGALSPYPFLLE
ncbi:MAG: hypothetical protein HKN20_18100 [Gemmatimonadetes bacterium]|nr:hypothetical protein [Gemmatimonadota bacterium]